MASSKGSPGPHDRKTPYERCIGVNRLGKRCKLRAKKGKLCNVHALIADGEYDVKGAAARAPAHGPDASPEAQEKGRLTQRIQQEASIRGATRPETARGGTRSGWVLNENARNALAKLNEFELAEAKDPKQALLELVTASHRNAQVWQAMLLSVPEDDWQYLGIPPLPGVSASHGHKGARIEIIQRNLSDAISKASRISKMAIDAGLEERMVRIAEQQSQLIADTVRAAVLAAIAALPNLSPKTKEAALAAALGAGAEHLRMLASGLPGQTAASPGPETSAASPDVILIEGKATTVAKPRSARRPPVEARR